MIHNIDLFDTKTLPTIFEMYLQLRFAYEFFLICVKLPWETLYYTYLNLYVLWFMCDFAFDAKPLTLWE